MIQNITIKLNPTKVFMQNNWPIIEMRIEVNRGCRPSILTTKLLDEDDFKSRFDIYWDELKQQILNFIKDNK